MAKRVTIADARDQRSAHGRSAEHGTPVVLTRRGRAVAVIVAADDVERLERLRAAGPQAGLAGLAVGWEGADALVDELARRRRGPTRRSREFD